MPFIQVNDINMYYQLYNEETSAETAVLLHGLGLNLELWKDITPFFERHYRVLLLDLRGHGRTERGTPALSWNLFVEDIHDLLQLLKIEHVHFIGHGFGGNLAIKYSLLHKEKVKSLSLLAAPAFYPQKSIHALIRRRRQLTSSGSMLPLAHSMVKGITLEPSGSRLFDAIVNAFTLVSPETYFEIFNLYLASPPNGDFDSLTHPTLSLVGSHDPLFLTSYTLSSSLLLKTQLLIVPHSSNAVFIDQPKLTFEWIHDFISGPPLETHDYCSLESEAAEQVIHYIHDIYEEGLYRLESLEVIQVDLLEPAESKPSILITDKE